MAARILDGKALAAQMQAEIAAAVTAHVSSEKRGGCGVFVVIDMVRAPV